MATELTVPRDEIVRFLNRRPFVPFVVKLSDGSVHDIVRVAQMGIGQTIGGITTPKGDKICRIKLSDIVSIEEMRKGS